jgi:hypothetical protein
MSQLRIAAASSSEFGVVLTSKALRFAQLVHKLGCGACPASFNGLIAASNAFNGFLIVLLLPLQGGG